LPTTYDGTVDLKFVPRPVVVIYVI